MLTGPGWMMSDLERAVQRAESAKRLSKLAGHFQGKGKTGGPTKDDERAFKKRVAKRRKKKGYR
jgi:hypothetical protein